MSEYALREALPEDADFLAECFLHALNFDAAAPPLSLAQWEASYAPDAWPEFRAYTASWARPGAVGIALQRGLVAVRADCSRVGAAWFRLFPPSLKGFAYLDAATPELCIGILPGHRGRGLGTRLLQGLAAAALAAGCTRLCLSAGLRNPALRLYTRLGARQAAPGDADAAAFSPAELARALAVDPEYPNFVLPLPLRGSSGCAPYPAAAAAGLAFGGCAIDARQVFWAGTHAAAVTNLRPQCPGHVLVISRRAEPAFEALAREEVAGLFEAARAAARALAVAAPPGAPPQGFTFALQDGAGAGQTVPHVHMHVLPHAAAVGVLPSLGAARCGVRAGAAACEHFAGSPACAGSESTQSCACAQPALAGHLLVAPARCVARAAELSDGEWADLGMAVQAAGRAARAGALPPAAAVTYCMQDGASAGQALPHTHFHVVPRVPGDLAEDEIYSRLAAAEAALGGGAGGAPVPLLKVDPRATASSSSSAEADAGGAPPPVRSLEDMWAEADTYRAVLL